MLRRFVVRFLPLLVLATWAALSAFPGIADAASGYVNPFSNPGYHVGRTDMGVDLCLAPGDPIGAVGDGLIVGIQKNWSGQQPYLWYELTSGPDAGRFVYVAEQITRLAQVGQRVAAGETIATYARNGTCIETGWAAADGETLAVATTGYTEGQVTTAGIWFARFLISLGVRGTFELTAPKEQPSGGNHGKRIPKPTSGKSSPAATTGTSHRGKRPATISRSPSGGTSLSPTNSGGGAWTGAAAGSSSSGSSGGSGLP